MSTLAPDPTGGALGREELLARIQSDRPLLSDYRSLDEQVQPNGIDLSLAEVGMLVGAATLGRTNAERVLPEIQTLPFDDEGWLDLAPGAYQVVFNEIVDLPNDLMALGRPRSSLCRSGAAVVTAVWDAGYRGRSTALLVVSNPAGLRLARDARIMQLVFFTLNTPTAQGYDGVYQGENIPGAAPVQSRRA
ncbi:MAG: deoxyuridine 5'-triphosphate nucleotidohydrolase [Thermomicrobiales bacterium]